MSCGLDDTVAQAMWYRDGQVRYPPGEDRYRPMLMECSMGNIQPRSDLFWILENSKEDGPTKPTTGQSGSLFLPCFPRAAHFPLLCGHLKPSPPGLL